MASGVFNIAKGKAAYYATLPAAADALVVVLLLATGLEADDVLNNHDDLAALIASTNDEATFTNYARKVVTAGITPTINDTTNLIDITMSNLVWTAAGGATNNSLGKLIVCYDGDTGAGTDANIIPLTYHDFTATTDGSDLTASVTAPGFYRAA